jgi:hypothetical protein
LLEKDFGFSGHGYGSVQMCLSLEVYEDQVHEEQVKKEGSCHRFLLEGHECRVQSQVEGLVGWMELLGARA